MSMRNTIRVLIVDDVAESRDNIAKLLRFEPEVEVVGLAQDGQQAIDLAFSLQPNVILLDVNMPLVDGITAASRITSRLPGIALIMMSVQNDPDYLRRAMVAGAREFLSKPFSLDELIESIRHVHSLSEAGRRGGPQVDTNASQSSTSADRAKIITVFSLKGGVGRSTIAANLAVALRQQEERDVVLFDANLLQGDMGVMLNLSENKTLSDIVRQFNTMDDDLISDILVTHSSGIRVLLPPPDVQSGEQVAAAHLRQLVEHLSNMAAYVVIDTQPGFDEATIALLDLADIILLPVTLELTSVTGARRFLELASLFGYDSDKVLLLLNRSTAKAGISANGVAESLRGEFIAMLPDDPPLTQRAINQGVPFVQSSPRAPLSQEVSRLANQLVRHGALAGVEAGTRTDGGRTASRLLGRLPRPAIRRTVS